MTLTFLLGLLCWFVQST